jgi:dimethylamine/trimethylamine dehydrogenase
MVSDAGLIDFADLDVAVEPDQFHLGMPPVFMEPHLYRPYVEAIRDAAGKVPVLSVLGRLTSVADGEAALAAGVCDMVGAARALIAEPYLVKNAFEGREERSRTCIACNWCMAAMADAAQTCTINPVAWRERTWGDLPPAPDWRKVIVVGGGPAGLEAARVAAIRGHDVTLMESRDRLGGALALWAELPGRGFYHHAIDWWRRELERLGVRIELNHAATAGGIMARDPGAVIVATGARYSAGGQSNHRDLDIDGHDRAFVHRPEEVMLGAAMPRGRIVILDAEGMHTGVGLAEQLAAEGNEVELLTPYFSPVSPRIAAQLEVPPLMKRLRSAGVNITANAYIRAIGDRAVTVNDIYSDTERVIADVDAVILSTGRIAVNDLERDLVGKVPQVFAIGDALAPRMWATASYEAHKFAREIGEPNGARSVSDIYFAQE